ncbi:MAG: PKD domain-containing protein [Bacteroidetes bacterium]|nr:MAG: PKD domain-containing protein [Bacteroidota bacterium]
MPFFQSVEQMLLSLPFFLFSFFLQNPACEGAVSRLAETRHPGVAPARSVPVALFEAPDSVADCTAVTVQFVNQSLGDNLSFLWLFPGGSPATSAQPDPEVEYGQSGRYAVTLIAVNGSGADTIVREIAVTVIGYPEAMFGYHFAGNRLVQFDNHSQRAANFTWYFGDGSPASDDYAPGHQYAQNGQYTVTLLADNFCGTSVFQELVPVGLTNVPGEIAGKPVVCYPNPVSDKLYLDWSALGQEPEWVRVFDARGGLVQSTYCAAVGNLTLDMNTLPAGAYWIWLKFQNHTVRRMVIRE